MENTKLEKLARLENTAFITAFSCFFGLLLIFKNNFSAQIPILFFFWGLQFPSTFTSFRNTEK
jgi:hypothetical protein